MPGVSGILVKERHVFRRKSKNGQIFELLAASFLNGHIVESNEAARRKGTRHVVNDNRSERQNEQIGIGMVAGTACFCFGGVRAHD